MYFVDFNGMPRDLETMRPNQLQVSCLKHLDRIREKNRRRKKANIIRSRYLKKKKDKRIFKIFF